MWGMDLSEGGIEFPGVIYPERYNTRTDRANGHHFIVWSGGTNAEKALINTDVPDERILAGLEALGAAPGNNLTEATWTERFNENSPAPDRRVEGARLKIVVSWEGMARPAYELLEGATESDLDIRFGGYEALIPLWRSGCVTCLFSCPGGRTSNAAFTIRDQALNRKSFRAERSKLPADGTPVRVIIQPVREELPSPAASSAASD